MGIPIREISSNQSNQQVNNLEAAGSISSVNMIHPGGPDVDSRAASGIIAGGASFVGRSERIGSCGSFRYATLWAFPVLVRCGFPTPFNTFFYGSEEGSIVLRAINSLMAGGHAVTSLPLVLDIKGLCEATRSEMQLCLDVMAGFERARDLPIHGGGMRDTLFDEVADHPSLGFVLGAAISPDKHPSIAVRKNADVFGAHDRLGAVFAYYSNLMDAPASDAFVLGQPMALADAIVQGLTMWVRCLQAERPVVLGWLLQRSLDDRDVLSIFRQEVDSGKAQMNVTQHVADSGIVSYHLQIPTHLIGRSGVDKLMARLIEHLPPMSQPSH